MAGGHFAAETTAQKVLQASLWWPTLFSDAVEFVKRCDPCQRATKPQNWDRMPLSINLATRWEHIVHLLAFLAFRLEVVMHMEYLVPSLRVAVRERLTEESLTERLVDLEQLEEIRLHAAYKMKVEKLWWKMWFNCNLKNKDLKEGDLCLMYGVRYTKRKLKY